MDFDQCLHCHEGREADEDALCAICLGTGIEGSSPTLLSCGHKFCAGCLERWFELAPTSMIACPTCKTDVLTSIPKELLPSLVTDATQNVNDTSINDPLCEGWAWKQQGMLLKTWRRRYVTVFADRIEWRKTSRSAGGIPLGLLRLSRQSVVEFSASNVPTVVVRADDQPNAGKLRLRTGVDRQIIAHWTEIIRRTVDQYPPVVHESLTSLRAVRQLARREHWKRCPQCDIVIVKARGCDHMRCRCGRRFDWSATPTVVPCSRLHLRPNSDGETSFPWALWGCTCPGCTAMATAKLMISRAACVTVGPPVAVVGLSVAIVTATAVVSVPLAVLGPLALIYQPIAVACKRHNPMVIPALSGMGLMFCWLLHDEDD